MESPRFSKIGLGKNAGIGPQKFPLTLRRFVSIYLFISALLFIAIRLYVTNDNVSRSIPYLSRDRSFKPVKPLLVNPSIFLSSSNEFFRNFTTMFHSNAKEEKEKNSLTLKNVSNHFLSSLDEFVNKSSRSGISLSRIALNATSSDKSQTPTLRSKARANSLNYVKLDFQSNWFRQRQARVDWRAILRPCVNHTQWAPSRPGWGKENRTNARMSHVSFRDIKPAGEFTRIFIQSRTADGFPKMVGGDFWRVNLRGPSSVDGTLIDHNNGTYEALFLIIEPGFYKLTFHLDYSLCDGLKEPPSDWFIKGETSFVTACNGSLAHLLFCPFSHSLLLTHALIRAFTPL